MNTREQLKTYQQILDKNEPLDAFNPWAFIFNSFYYFWKDISISKFFLYFLATPVLFMLLLLLTVHAGLNIHAGLIFAVAFLVVRITAGFRANIDLKKRMETFVAKYKDADTTPEPIVYFSISRRRLFFASILTLGIYDLYWAYKNWQAVRTYNKEYEITPVFRSWFFGMFFIYPLFLRMKKSFAQTVPAGFTFKFCALAYLLLVITDIISSKIYTQTDNDLIWIISIAASFLSVLCLLPIQQAVNKHNQKLNPQNVPLKKFLPGEKITILVSVLLVSLSFFAGYKNGKETEFLFTMYIHEQAYPDICRKYGYEMRQYPETFRRMFSVEHAEIEQEMKNRGISPAQYWDQIPVMYRKTISAHLEQTMIEISRETKAGYDHPLATVAGFCAYMDDNAEPIIREQTSTD